MLAFVRNSLLVDKRMGIYRIRTIVNQYWSRTVCPDENLLVHAYMPRVVYLRRPFVWWKYKGKWRKKEKQILNRATSLKDNGCINAYLTFHRICKFQVWLKKQSHRKYIEQGYPCNEGFAIMWLGDVLWYRKKKSH